MFLPTSALIFYGKLEIDLHNDTGIRMVAQYCFLFQIPVSGSTAYPIPPMCTTHPFFLSPQLPNTVPNQNMCTSMHMPWPGVHPRLPTHQVPVSHMQPVVNPLLQFTSAGHPGSGSTPSAQQQLNMAAHPGRMVHNTQSRLQVGAFLSSFPVLYIVLFVSSNITCIVVICCAAAYERCPRHGH